MRFLAKLFCWLVWPVVAAVLAFLIWAIVLSAKGQSVFDRLLPAKQAQPACWSFIEISDLHAGSYLAGNEFTNTVNSIISNAASWNLKFLVSAVDLYEQTEPTNWYTPQFQQLTMVGDWMTNQLWRLRHAGISVMCVPGNHDSDYTNSVGIGTNIVYWNNVFGTAWQAGDADFYSNEFTGDTRNCAYKVVVGTSKFLFIGMRWIDNYNTNDVQNGGLMQGFANTNEMVAAYQPEVNWFSNVAAANPDCYVVAVTHFFTDQNGQPTWWQIGGGSYTNEGPGFLLWNAVATLPNSLMVLCGHVTPTPLTVTPLTANDGHKVTAIKFNTQSSPTDANTSLRMANGEAFCLYTVYPASHVVWCRIYDSTLGRFLNPGEWASLQSNGAGIQTTLWTQPLQ